MRRNVTKDLGVLQQYSFKKQLQALWFYSEGYHTEIIVSMMATILLSGIGLVPTFLYGKIINKLSNSAKIPSSTLGTLYSRLMGDVDADNEIFYLIGLSLVCQLALHLVENFKIYKTKLLSDNIHNQTVLKTWNHLLSLDYQFHEQNSQGTTFSRVEAGARSVRSFLLHILSTTLTQILGLVFSISLLFSADKYIGFYALFTFTVYIIMGVYSNNRLIIHDNQYQAEKDKATGRVYDFFSHILIIKLLNMKDRLMGILTKSFTDLLVYARVWRLQERYKVGINRAIMSIASLLLLTYIAATIVRDRRNRVVGGVDVGEAVMILGYFDKFVRHTKLIGNDYQDMVSTRTGMYRLSLLFENKPTIVDVPKPLSIPDNWQSIDFHGVTFSYKKKETGNKAGGEILDPVNTSARLHAIQQVSLSIKRGERLAIVGLSGSGKSTCAKLLLRLYTPKAGYISIGGVDTRQITCADLHTFMRIVPQDNELINDTLLENFRIMGDDVTEEEINQALQCAAAWDFVCKLPKKLDTIIGPRGVQLSGGEKQRICIARALLSKPKLLVLDEATSQLDVITEKEVFSHIHHNLSRAFTTLVAITHRISSLHLFDRILIMNSGNIVGCGTHDELLSTNIYYQKLHQMSAQGEH